MRRKLILWAWDYPDWFWRPIVKLSCLVRGHQPEPDHCGLPEHDTCTWCLKIMPGQATR